MKNTLQDNQISYMIKVQDLIAYNKKLVKDIVVNLYLDKVLSQDEFRVFALRHGMTNDQQSLSFSAIANKFDWELEDTLKTYNKSLKIVSNDLRSAVLNTEYVK